MNGLTMVLGMLLAAAPAAAPAPDPLLTELLALERSALDRWIRLDPQGYLDLYAPEMTYFDPMTEGRVDGVEALTASFAPMRAMKSPVKDARYELVSPRLQRHGDVALLTFNVTNYGRTGDAPEAMLSRWNSTEVYARLGGKWKIIHSHWSLVKPDLKRPAS